MPAYDFKCECGETDTIIQSMSDPFPDMICKECGEEMKQDFSGKMGSTSVIIPNHMQAAELNKPEIKFDKSPSRKKHFF